ncbi:TolC family protein [Desulfotruncus alcoholivorax]|uniref:TolC family protein n=1 Tax=Desulfotruncus alcoholivorax TaxID=265477 RepID=UPI0003FE2802|nr:TolC family protein [Desulfotruncus alcoholivorax]
MRKTVVIILTLAVLLGGFTTAALAREPATPQLDLQKVIDMALANSQSLKSKDYEKQQAWEKREDAKDNFNVIPDGATDPATEAKYTALMQSSLNYLMKGKMLDQTKKQISLDAYTKYINVLMAEENLKYAEIALEKDKLAERLAKLSYQVGTTSKPELIGAQSGASVSESSVNVARENLDKAYIELNSLIGLWPEDRPVLQDDIEFEEFKVDNIDAEVNRAETSSENLWYLEQLVTLQKMDLRYFNYGPGSGQLGSYKVEKYDVDIAEQNAQDAQKQIKEGVQTLYKDILALAEQYKTLVAANESLEELLRVTKVKYDVGMATKMDVQTVQANLAKNQMNIELLKYKNAIMVATFKSMTGKNII